MKSELHAVMHLPPQSEHPTGPVQRAGSQRGRETELSLVYRTQKQTYGVQTGPVSDLRLKRKDSFVGRYESDSATKLPVFPVSYSRFQTVKAGPTEGFLETN